MQPNTASVKTKWIDKYLKKNNVWDKFFPTVIVSLYYHFFSSPALYNFLLRSVIYKIQFSVPVTMCARERERERESVNLFSSLFQNE